MASLTTLQNWVTEAEQALHRLATGSAVTVVVDQNGERVEYGRATMGQLRQYIADLKGQIAAIGSSGAKAYGPLRPFF